MNTRVLIVVAFAFVGVGTCTGAQKSGGALTAEGPEAFSADSNNSFAQAFVMARQFRSEISRIKRSGSPLSEEQVVYERMVGQMSVPPQLAHLAFPDVDTDREWTLNAKRVAKGIKPKINYHVDNGETTLQFQGTPSIQQNLHDNVRIIAWYRDQIEQVCPSKEKAAGTWALARVIDAFLNKFADSVPQVNVQLTGKINEPKDQKIEYSQREVWEMLATINRYFFYKVQIHDEQVEEFYPADVLLMGSMVRTAAIYGAAPPADALATIETKLKPDSEDWRADAYDALSSLAEEQQKPNPDVKEVCTITIPKPLVSATPKSTDPNAFPPDVEDVKEIGGKIFIKRKGFWTLWEKK
jgi:hypothetical protein